MCESLKEARREQTQREITRFTKEVTGWKTHRIAQDTDEKTGQYRGQYDSQLNAVFNEVEGAATIISKELKALVLKDTALGDVYAKCAQTDRRLVWLRRVFSFFREKFDQRDDPNLAETLEAADEVVWSCYSPFFQNEATKQLREPPPLPYIAAEYSPTALRRDQTPGSLLKKGKDFDPLQRYLSKLPIPIIQLPPNILTAPWMLVLVAHEVGHFIQPIIQPDQGYLLTFSTTLDNAIAKADGSDRDRSRWKSWAPEIFADWYSVICTGQWALWVMAQFEIQDNPTMLVERGSYPSPIARLALLASLTDAYLPGEGAKMLDDLGLNPKQIAESNPDVRDLSFVEAISKAIVQPLPGNLGKLENLLTFRAEEFIAKGEVEKRSNAFLAGKNGEVKNELRRARLIAASMSRACSEAMRITQPAARETAMNNIPKGLQDIAACAPPGKRAAPARAEVAGAPAPGSDLAGILNEIVDSDID